MYGERMTLSITGKKNSRQNLDYIGRKDEENVAENACKIDSVSLKCPLKLLLCTQSKVERRGAV
jgi:hypothetical protein